jgi:hypothetical protein
MERQQPMNSMSRQEGNTQTFRRTMSIHLHTLVITAEISQPDDLSISLG